MNQALTTTNTELVAVNETLLVEYMDAMGLAAKLTPSEKKQFLQIAQAYQLNPFKREIYATKYGEGQYAQFSIVVGYETYLKRAERSGKLDGWKVEFTDYEDGELSATITIYRKDWTRPFEWEVFYSEQVQTTKDGKVNKFWQKRRQQLRKVAISQGMRLAFPDENGGLPYTNDEMSVDIQDTNHEVISQNDLSGKGQQAVAKIMDQAGAALEAKVTTAPAEKKTMTKKEGADLMQALDAWNKALGAMMADPDRNADPIAYDVQALSLGAIPNLDRAEKRKMFEGLVNLAFENGVDYDKGKTNKFYRAEPTQPTDEEMSAALAEMASRVASQLERQRADKD